MRGYRTHSSRTGFTIVELLVVVSIIALLIALLLPAVAKGRDKALITQSIGNLKNLATANETYGGDWNDRQFTTCPDDAGLAQGNCTTYLANITCPPQQFLGWDGGSIWGYFLGSTGKCAQFGWPEACYNWIVYIPMQFGTAGNPGGGNAFGAFRMPSIKAFHDYVGGKFYEPTFYAPKDVVPLANISKYFTSPSEFAYDGVNYEDSSYCFSPAAMWDPKVMKRNGVPDAQGNIPLSGNGFTAPTSALAGASSHRSPPVSRCSYPTLKTRMIEHNWLQNPPDSLINMNFGGGVTPWFFNHGYNSAPASLFFDGHIEIVGCQRAQQAENRAGKLWSRNTSLGGAGYYGGQSFDFLVNTSFHILTTDGIHGRDTLGAEG
ncbi:MAG: prepilin-type N-terminal cleavage/methylation domain-containing protein [Planctomycetota bacterium]|nr:MAG: prepilin-type N-terminal cleavage/methylation domain-containing protein [Planctomycetota bacterium]RLS93019.1 MAG: prepilin-type N-terminal cleavage/methylation domain-containing protein [Planctomycetota bacterium]